MTHVYSLTERGARRRAVLSIVLLAALCAAGCSAHMTGEVVELLVSGDSRQLRDRPDDAPPNSPNRPALLVLALDGVDRPLLYDLLREGRLPALAGLLAGEGATFPHAYFEESLVATLPSSTMTAWVTAFTGVGPAHHGVTGNEFFIRERRELAVPISGATSDAAPNIACFTDDYADSLCLVPSVYERMRARDPDVLIWSAMQLFHAGADRLLLTDRTVLVNASRAFIQEELSERLNQEESRELYETVDGEIVDEVIDSLEDGPLPDVLTVYFAGVDQFAHVAEMGPDAARRQYLVEVLDPLFGRLAKALQKRDALRDRYVVVTADHGHVAVLADDAHALESDGEDEPPEVLRRAGFRVRPFSVSVPPEHDFQAVLTYQGAMAYVYVADRSTCNDQGQPCDWRRPPRYREDVLAAAEAFYRSSRDGQHVPQMRDTLDLVLTRRPKAIAENDLPFEVYVGGGKTVAVETYLRQHPMRSYVELDARLRDLAVGPAGERAGDILLIAHNGDRARPEDRYYFSPPYHSHHGSPARQDSLIPLIVAHPEHSASAIGGLVRRALGAQPRQQKVTDLLLALRFDDRRERHASR